MSNESNENVIDCLRRIRDRAWQMHRIDPHFGEIESLAKTALSKLGINDGPPYPNPRPYGWWNDKICSDSYKS